MSAYDLIEDIDDDVDDEIVMVFSHMLSCFMSINLSEPRKAVVYLHA